MKRREFVKSSIAAPLVAGALSGLDGIFQRGDFIVYFRGYDNSGK